VVPVAEGSAGKQGIGDAPCPAAALDAVLLAPCVEAFDASPGNCTAACGLVDGAALIPAAALADADPVVTGPAAGAGVNDVDAFDGPVDEPTPDEPASQPSAIERLPMNEPPEQGAPGRLAVPVVVALNAEATGLDDAVAAKALAPVVIPP
jgi:hypothetical protein